MRLTWRVPCLIIILCDLRSMRSIGCCSNVATSCPFIIRNDPNTLKNKITRELLLMDWSRLEQSETSAPISVPDVDFIDFNLSALWRSRENPVVGKTNILPFISSENMGLSCFVEKEKACIVGQQTKIALHR